MQISKPSSGSSTSPPALSVYPSRQSQSACRRRKANEGDVAGSGVARHDTVAWYSSPSGMQWLPLSGRHNKIPPEMKRIAILVTLTALCRIASAQTIVGPAVFSPTAPTNQNSIFSTVQFVSAVCSYSQATDVSGNVITLTITIYTCLGGPSGSVPVAASFGPLPAGSYTFKVYWQFVGQPQPPTLAFQQSLTVTAAPPPVPALSPTSLLATALVLLTLGLVTLTRTPR
jgi:hypothetical protein